MESFAQLCRLALKRTMVGGVVACALFHAPLAHANFVPGQLYDARSAGMAGTGVADNDSGAASYHNPANLTGIVQSTTTLTLSPFVNQLYSPMINLQTGAIKQTDSTAGFSPLFQLGSAYRVHENVVVGANLFIAAGLATKYNSVTMLGGTPFSVSLIVGELQIPVAIKIIDELSIGIAYRMSYATVSEDGSTPVQTANGPVLVQFSESAHAFNFAGVQAGINYHPIPELSIGVNYRNSLKFDLSSGTVTAGGASTPVPPGTDLKMPDEFQGGAAVALLDKKLNIAAEYKYFLYSKASSTFTEGFQDGWSAALGGEYYVTDMVPVRVGYSFGLGATADKVASFYGVPPGYANSVTVGSGVRFDAWTVDLSLGYAWYNRTLKADASAPTVIPGQYGLNSYELFLSGTYRL